MNVLAWIAFGLITGVVANMIDPAPSKGGIFGAVVLGVVGALVGGFLASTFFGIEISGFNLETFIVSVLGALLLLFLGRAFRGERLT